MLFVEEGGDGGHPSVVFGLCVGEGPEVDV